MPRPDVHCPPPVIIRRPEPHCPPPVIIIDRDRDRQTARALPGSRTTTSGSLRQTFRRPK
jgi:hypothetical protein